MQHSLETHRLTERNKSKLTIGRAIQWLSCGIYFSEVESSEVAIEVQK